MRGRANDRAGTHVSQHVRNSYKFNEKGFYEIRVQIFMVLVAEIWYNIYKRNAFQEVYDYEWTDDEL